MSPNPNPSVGPVGASVSAASPASAGFKINQVPPGAGGETALPAKVNSFGAKNQVAECDGSYNVPAPAQPRLIGQPNEVK